MIPYRPTEIEMIGGLSMKEILRFFSVKDPCNKAVISCWKTETKDATVDKWGEIYSGLRECCYKVLKVLKVQSTQSAKSRNCVWFCND